MEWEDYERGGEVIGSVANAGRIRIDVTRYNDAWWMMSTGITDSRELASDKLDEAKCQAQAAWQVALEEALAALVGEDMALSHSACPHVNAFRKHCAKRK